MKLLLVDATADTSSKDYFEGYRAALQRGGHDVYVYAANGRIGVAASYLDYCWRKAKRIGEDKPRPTGMDSVYWAGIWSLEMALRLMPDWIIVVSGMFVLKDTLTLLRKASWPHSKMALMVCDSPYDDNQVVNYLPLFDAVFTNEMASVPIFRQFNPNTSYLPACYDPERHRPDLPIDDDVPHHDVVFVGSGFDERIELLSDVDWSGIGLGLYGNWQGLPSRHRLRQYVRGGAISNDRAAQLYRAAKIGLNLHRSRLSNPNVPLPPGMAKSLNPRAYELAACGVFQVSDWRDEIKDVFWVGSEVGGGSLVTTFDPKGRPGVLQEVIQTYLRTHDFRAWLAIRQHVAVQGHTYDARVAQLLEVLGERAAAA